MIGYYNKLIKSLHFKPFTMLLFDDLKEPATLIELIGPNLISG